MARSETTGSTFTQYDFTTETETPITSGHNIDSSPVFSPDGKSLAFIRNARSLMVYDMAAKKEREVSKIYTDPEPILGTGQHSLVA